jgi:DNA (cytosine-5)-methyltransferase 1
MGLEDQHVFNEKAARFVMSAHAAVLPFDTTQITSAANYSNPKPGDACHPLAAGMHPPAIAFAHQAGGIQTTLGYDPEAGTSPTLAKCQTPEIDTGMAVRRLTPPECERLQGFPDGWTDIRHGGKATPDGPRYKSLGNSMAIPPMRWLGQRIALVESIKALQVAA